MSIETQAQAVEAFAKANGFPSAKIVYWDDQAIEGVDDIPGRDRGAAMENYGPEDGDLGFSLGISLGRSTKLRWADDEIEEAAL